MLSMWRHTRSFKVLTYTSFSRFPMYKWKHVLYTGNILLQVSFFYVFSIIWTQGDVIIFLLGCIDMVLIFLKVFQAHNKHSIHKTLNDKRDLSPVAGMSGSVYVTQLMTLYAVSLNDRRTSCAFMSFLDKLGWGGGCREKCFLIRACENNSPHVLSVPETTGKDLK